MKTKFIKYLGLILLIFTAISVKAQVSDEFLQIGTNEVQGTARFSAMGGAFNALGGDFSSLSSNPAGIGVYRSSEFTVTPSLTINNVATDFRGTSLSNSRVRFGLPSIGYVGAWYSDTDNKLTSFNVAIGYNRTANFYKTANFQGFNSPISVLDGYANHANVVGKDNSLYRELNEIFPNDWSTALAAQSIMIEENDAGEYQVYGFLEGDKVDISGRTLQSGTTGEYVISLGGNILNKLQFGVTVGIQDLESVNYLRYREDYVRGNEGIFTSHERNEYTRNTGLGYNLKAGIIYRPIQSLRLGLALHTPTFFHIKREYNLIFNSSYYNPDENNNDLSELQTPTDIYEYDFATPYKIELGLAYIVGKIGLVSVDYELVGNNAMRMLYDQYGSERSWNDGISESFRATSNLRVGAEVNLPYGIVLRGGYNYFQSPYKDSQKLNFDRQAYSCGAGFRGKNFFIDVAYVLNSGNYYYTPYFVNDYRTRDTDINGNAVYATEKSELSRIIATLGFKF